MEDDKKHIIASHFLCQALRLPKSISKGIQIDRTTPTFEMWRKISSRILSSQRQDKWVKQYLRRIEPSGVVLASLIDTHLIAMAKAGGRMICLNDSEYPNLLRHISDPPLAMSALGPPLSQETERAAVVGSRRASSESLKMAFVVGQQLLDKKIGVVSGGAYGCDVASQKGWISVPCANNEGKSITVFANGLGNLYPKGCQSDFSKFLETKIVFLSENFWNAPALPAAFLHRNRIISGLCKTTVIIEAQKKSGAMATANLALNQGREVLTYLHSKSHYRVAGNEQLILDGAISFQNDREFNNCFDGLTGSYS